MRYILFFLTVFIFSGTFSAKAQRFYSANEYGFCAGGSQYFGDLNDHYGFQTIHPAYGAFLRTPFNPYISVRGMVNYTTVGYDDKYNNNAYENARNLNFTSNILEIATQFEFNFFRYSTGELGSRFTPYLTGGIGVFHYDPFTNLNGNKLYLRSVGTEGQYAGFSSRKYSNWSMCFPIGVGVKWWLRPGMNLGFEIVDRLTTTDYLDDVSSTYVGADKFAGNPVALALQDRSQELGSTALGRAGKQRGDVSSYDQYIMALFTVSFQFKVYRCPGYLKEGFLL